MLVRLEKGKDETYYLKIVDTIFWFVEA